MPVALVLATVLTGVLAHLVVAELPWSERLDGPGTFTFALVFGGLLTAPLVVLSLLSAPRPSIVRALVGTAATTVVFAVVAVIARFATQDLRPDLFIGSRDAFVDRPVDTVLFPYRSLVLIFVDFDTLNVTVLDTSISLTAVIALGLLMAVLGAGATLASGGRALSALLAAIGAAGGAAVGEVFVQYGSFQWPGAFFTDLRGPTLLVLTPIVLSGIGLGLGALLGRGGARVASTSGPFAGHPAPPQPLPAQQSPTPTPAPGPAPLPPDGPPPGATTF